jgi:hypothetical protein
MIAPAFPRRLLAPLAFELARRCDISTSALEQTEKKLQVDVARHVPLDPLAEMNHELLFQPEGSKIVVDSDDSGTTITVPPEGFRSAANTLLLMGLAMSLVMALILSSAARLPKGVTALFAGVLLIGILLISHGIRIARRRAAIAIVGQQLMVIQTGLIRSTSKEWDLEQVTAIRVGPSGMTVNEEPVLELQILERDKLPFSMLAGRDEPELQWLASLLRSKCQVSWKSETPPST